MSYYRIPLTGPCPACDDTGLMTDDNGVVQDDVCPVCQGLPADEDK